MIPFTNIAKYEQLTIDFTTPEEIKAEESLWDE